MAVVLDKANVVLVDKDGNRATVTSLTDNDLNKLSVGLSDVSDLKTRIKAVEDNGYVSYNSVQTLDEGQCSQAQANMDAPGLSVNNTFTGNMTVEANVKADSMTLNTRSDYAKLSASTNDHGIKLLGGSSATTGASIDLRGSTDTDAPNTFTVSASSGVALAGSKDGSLTWNSENVVRKVNNLPADASGNVLLGTEKSTFNKVVYDTGYFSIGTSATYNFDLTGTDLENVSKENVNIRLVAKVTTAHNGFEVGDIAQLSPGIDNVVDLSGNNYNLDVCAYIRDNTLYIYSGNNSAFSIHNGTGWLQKANVQIKAVLTAFIPDDGSILLIAEDQTNTSKLIGLPDGTLTWNGTNISLLSPVHYARSSNFGTSGQTSIKLPSYLSLMVNGRGFRNDAEVTIDISDQANWDSTTTDYTIASNRAGKDFYIYAVDQGTVDYSVRIILSANSTVPTGYTAATSRKIGGFHCLCADVGAPTWIDPATKTSTAHWLSGYVKGDILPYSVWDLLHRAESSNEGMVFSPETHVWYDIYLSSWDGSKLVSVYGGTTADGTSSKPFHGEMFAECAGKVNKELVSRDEFVVVAKGSNEKTAIKGAADAGTTGGHTDTAGLRMISNIGLEDCCGFLWQWCRQSGGANGSSGWVNSVSATPVDTATGVYGQSYGTYYRALVGGGWNLSSYCGSRCVHVYVSSAAVIADCGGRLSARERVVTGL